MAYMSRPINSTRLIIKPTLFPKSHIIINKVIKTSNGMVPGGYFDQLNFSIFKTSGAKRFGISRQSNGFGRPLPVSKP